MAIITPCKFSQDGRILLSIVFVLGSEMTMNNLNKNKRNAIVTAEMILVTLVTVIVLVSNMATTTTPVAAALTSTRGAESSLLSPGAPVVVSGDNIYIAWWTNNTEENGNQEVMFRASNDGGATFGDKMNLSNTPDADSTRVEIAGEGANVIVTWWETNQTSDTPVARISTDSGETFGPVLMLGANGTLTNTEE